LYATPDKQVALDEDRKRGVTSVENETTLKTFKAARRRWEAEQEKGKKKGRGKAG